MSDVAEMRDSPVGRGFTPAGSSDDEDTAAINGRPTAIPPSNSQKPETNNAAASFDAARLHSQLANLLQLYLARAADLGAVAQCSAKDALACAKALTAMMYLTPNVFSA